MKQLSIYILIFSITFAVFLITPAFLGRSFPGYPLMNWADILDILTPLVLLPLYWLLFWYASTEKINLNESLVFVVLAGMWVEGQGMHLSANSIGHLLNDFQGDANLLTLFYDEKLSHYLWHLGIFGMAVLLIYRSLRNQNVEENITWILISPAGIIHGLTIFLIVIEGGTTLIGIPFLLLISLAILFLFRDRLSTQPLISFYFISCILAFLFIAGWCIYFGDVDSCCPEPSAIGLI